MIELATILLHIIIFSNWLPSLGGTQKENSSHTITIFEGKSIVDFHRRLVHVYEKVALDVSRIKRCVIRLNDNHREKGETLLLCPTVLLAILTLTLSHCQNLEQDFFERGYVSKWVMCKDPQRLKNQTSNHIHLTVLS